MTWLRDTALRPDHLVVRSLLVAMLLIQLGVLVLTPKDVIASYPRAYRLWITYGGTDPQWIARLGAVSAMGATSLFWIGSWTRPVGAIASFAMGVLFACEGLMFAALRPPQTGTMYFAPSIWCMGLAFHDGFHWLFRDGR